MNGTINLDQILCPVVPSNSSDEGLQCAIALARVHGAKLFVLNCVDEPVGSLPRLEAREGLTKSIERSVDLHNVSNTTAYVHIEKIGDGFKITSIDLKSEAEILGIDEQTFIEHAEATRKNCPVSQALAGTKINLQAKLVQSADWELKA
jgi:hypothetical protein